MPAVKKIVLTLTGIILAVIIVFVGISSTNTFNVSATSVQVMANAFDNTNVNEDLSDINLNEYDLSSTATPQIVSFTEYCYAESILNCGNYGLYLYVLTPEKPILSQRQGANVINIATSYGEDGEPTAYSNLPLKVCGVSTGSAEGLIYKFRVLDEGNVILQNARNLEKIEGSRRYDIAGVQLYELGAESSEEYGIGGIYRFSGYSKGYANGNKESSLKSTVQPLDTVSLKPEFTNYRMPSEYKDNTRMEVNTAYFSVSDKYFKEYGALQKIHAQWYEYKTEYLFVTETAVFNALYDYIGEDIGAYNDEVGYDVWSNKDIITGMGSLTCVDIGYNKSQNHAAIIAEQISKIAWLFETGGLDFEDYEISKDVIKAWAQDYSSRFNKGADILEKYSDDLFTDSIDENRIALLANQSEKRGLIDRSFDIGEENNLLSYDDTHDGWQRFWDYFWNWSDESSGINSGATYAPIYEVTQDDLNKSEADFCNDLLIAQSDYNAVYTYCESEIQAGRHPILFRFAQTDYYSQEMFFDDVNDFYDPFLFDEKNGYISQETVFLNFDIIDLTFRGEAQGDTILPVVMNPVDVFNGIDPPIIEIPSFNLSEIFNNLKQSASLILGVLIFILIFYIVVKIIRAIFNFNNNRKINKLYKESKNNKKR